MNYFIFQSEVQIAQFDRRLYVAATAGFCLGWADGEAKFKVNEFNVSCLIQVDVRSIEIQQILI